MIDQFEAEKGLNAASADNLRLMIIDSRMICIPEPRLKVDAKLRGLPG